jgi:hypothetical protein
MNETEIIEIRKFISCHNKLFRRFPQLMIDENNVLVEDDCERCKNVLDLIMKNESEILDFFNFRIFLKPLIRKLAIKLFDYGVMRADDCLYYCDIKLR